MVHWLHVLHDEQSNNLDMKSLNLTVFWNSLTSVICLEGRGLITTAAWSKTSEGGHNEPPWAFKSSTHCNQKSFQKTWALWLHGLACDCVVTDDVVFPPSSPFHRCLFSPAFSLLCRLGGCLSRVLDEDFYKQPFSELIGYVYVAPTNILPFHLISFWFFLHRYQLPPASNHHHHIHLIHLIIRPLVLPPGVAMF